MTESMTELSAPLPMAPLVDMQKITKSYRGVPAVRDVDFDLRKGEIHALLGENGAGKSTLTKVMAGVVEATSGRMLYRGREVSYASPFEALRDGIAMVFQETSLVPSMTVAQNLYLGDEKFLNRLRGRLHRRPAVPAIPELLRRSHGPGRHLGRRQAPDGGDRARRPSQGRGHHLRRAHGLAHAGGEAAFLHPDAPAEGPRRLHRLHLPCAGGGAHPCRPHHHPARRRAGGERRGEGLRPRDGDPRHGRPHPLQRALPHAPQRRRAAPGRRQGALGAGHLHEQCRAQQLLLDL